MQPQIIAPRTGLIRPSGRPRVNWAHPLAQALSLLYVFDYQGGPLYIDNGQAPGSLTAGTTADIARGPCGMGLSGSSANATFGVPSPTAVVPLNSYQAPNSAGSCFVFTTTSWGPTDSLGHECFQLGNPTSGSTATIDLVKFSDNNWYFGFTTSPSDLRAIFAASGTFTAGDSFIAGGTWNAKGPITRLYVKGKFIGSVAKSGTVANSHSFTVNNENSSVSGWCRSLGKDMIYWMAIWKRELTDGEIAYLNLNPWCFLTFPEDELIADMIKGTIALPTFNVGSFNRQFPTPNFRAYPVETARSFPRY